MELNIQDWGAVGEMVGGFAVVLTLTYLARQLRQSSKALQITNSDAASAMNAEVFQELISNPEFWSKVRSRVTPHPHARSRCSTRRCDGERFRHRSILRSVPHCGRKCSVSEQR